MDVLGRDSIREGYRVATGGGAGRIVGLIPDHVISQTVALTGGHGHQTAYEWLAARSRTIEQSLQSLRDGHRPRPPFDRMELVEE
ncbi:hypothetical protein [Pelagovum pacificum]|uniref:Uncharacterized protein n=1 Tax=Pelagovum pacificum TaxID=2588711 RepID=A0A5C5GAY6_9RHOB|nr:hypothetical protein [Pelagovum pacificum]QQA41227.1 hypothetical protein I8N54_10325 [Pelagovum pacificum]TNY31965.1 hypothetical protein FHY64_01275 [Pelagovum pacificum]